MYANQLNVVFKQDRLTLNAFKGVFPCDKIIDPNTTSNCFVVVNTSPSTGTGEHWLLFFKIDDCAFCFDSLANKIETYNKCTCRAFEKFSQNCMSTFFNSKRLQATTTDVCGIYCIYVARELCSGKSINSIERRFTANLLKNDQKITNWFNKYLKKHFIKRNFLCKNGQLCCCETEWKK